VAKKKRKTVNLVKPNVEEGRRQMDEAAKMLCDFEPYTENQVKVLQQTWSNIGSIDRSKM
jgi:hypothetical protein